MPKLPKNKPPSKDAFEANTSEREKHHITQSLVARKRAAGDVRNKVKIRLNDKTVVFVRPEDSIKKFEKYASFYPDAKIVL